MTDKGSAFYEDGERPGDAVAEWHFRVEQLTRATKPVVKQRYGKSLRYTYITGISNGGYLTRYALENTPGLSTTAGLTGRARSSRAGAELLHLPARGARRFLGESDGH
jgi:hypothetical protein